jgi:hypothetical protein
MCDYLNEIVFGEEVGDDAVGAVTDLRHRDVEATTGAKMNVVGKELKPSKQIKVVFMQ